MNRIARYLSCLVLVLLLSSTGAFAQLFEGTITMEIASAKLQQPMTMVISSKGDKSTTEMSMPQGSMKLYFDKAAGKMTTVMGKMGMVMEMKKLEDMAKEKPGIAENSVKQTGERKEINGHSCELYVVTSKDSSQSNWWMTNDLPKSLLNSLHNYYENSGRGAMAGRNGGPGLSAIREMFSKGLVPIKVEMLKEGKPETTMTFVSFQQKHIEDSEFVIPSDVHLQDMPNMGGH